MHALAVKLADAFRRDFFAADQSIKWTHAEEERELWLDAHTVIVGRIDARGINAEGKPFIGEWKSLSKNKARNIEQVKAEWKLAPQSLTYGVLMGDECRDFTIRWAIKTDPQTTDFEWYSYTDAELEWWTHELKQIAAQIRLLRSWNAWKNSTQPDNWPVNLTHCTRYGWNYRCQFFDNGCSKLNFTHVPDGLTPRDPHLEIEKKIRAASDDPQLVILDASRTKDWMGCHEYYRRMWEASTDASGLVTLGLSETNENLVIGNDFHALVDEHIKSMIKE